MNTHRNCEVIDAAMLDVYDKMAAEIGQKASSAGNHQYLVGIAGPPGGGKSTTVQRLQERIPNSVVVPMDGYHYTKEQLRNFSDPEAALARRGAHWTFDAEAFVSALTKLRETGAGSFPSFMHGVGDPVDHSIEVTAQHKIVLIEGNYLLLDVAPWDKIKNILDFSYFIDCPLAVVEQRILRRHMEVNGNTAERALERVTINDSPNAQLVLAHKHRADAIIQSL